MRKTLFQALVLLFSFTQTPPLQAQEQTAAQLYVELNKLEAGEATCQAFFLFRNDSGMSFEALELSFAILDTNGIINQLLTVDAAPTPVARTSLKLFEFPDIACPQIGELLLHDIPACTPQNAEPRDCYPLITLSSRAAVPLIK
ncbi:hypothetical protein [uncultured Shimia sp.]|uniref:hypothetical protein n=1 Tax=uncultured Shimia sp. TaxID=573152 RepID=UPI002604CA2C|nr:hypothetical protein [uncultured Shimia sp.]